jgi:hypothetical protein
VLPNQYKEKVMAHVKVEMDLQYPPNEGNLNIPQWKTNGMKKDVLPNKTSKMRESYRKDIYSSYLRARVQKRKPRYLLQ